MKLFKVLTAILGFIMIGFGITCMIAPFSSFLTLGYIMAVSMVIEGIAGIVAYAGDKKGGYTNGFTLASGIISLIFGIIVMSSAIMQLSLELFFVIAAAIWIIIMGCIRIVLAIQLKKASADPQFDGVGKRWWLVLIFGILMVLFGIFGLINPAIMALTIGLMIGLSIVTAGVTMFSVAVA